MIARICRPPHKMLSFSRLFSQFTMKSVEQSGSFLYTKNHEWIQIFDNSVVLGLTKYALEKLGDLVFIEIPKPGERIRHDGSNIVANI